MLVQQVIPLVNQNQFPGFKSVVCNGINDLGKPVQPVCIYTQSRRNSFQKPENDTFEITII